MIQRIFFRVFQATFKLTEILFPALAGKWVVKLFFTPRKFKRPGWETNLLKDARKRKITFKSDFKMGVQEDYYVRYEWGSNGPVVLLVHGWEGRGSQMGHFVEPLRKAGYRVITFDAIAHGDSPGKQTSMPEFAQIIRDIDADVGGFHAIIGHSLGGTAAGYAAANGVRTKKLITICSPTTIEFIFESFAQQIHAAPKTIRRLSQFLENFAGKSPGEYSFTNFASEINVPGLIVHDRTDKEIPYREAVALHEQWNGSRLLLTEGFGHRRILRSDELISKVLNFVTKRQNESQLKSVISF